MARRTVRLEEYAASGVTNADADDGTYAHMKVHSLHSVDGTRKQFNKMHVASISHRQNEQYLEDFDAAYEELASAAAQQSGKKVSTHTPVEVVRTVRKSTSMSATRGQTTAEQRADNEVKRSSSSVGDLEGIWLTGPVNPEGFLHAVSAHPLLCMSMSADEREVVVGSSDHALYVIPLHSSSSGSTGPRRRESSNVTTKPKTLYTKKFGHTEWVTCVTHLPDNRIVSGGMDSKLCLWDATGVKCEELIGHSGSVSLVLNAEEGVVLSAGYDKTVRLWNVTKHASSRQREISSIKAGAAPILDASIFNDKTSVVCGDRDGSIHVIDLNETKVFRKHPSAHKGHVTSVLASKHDADLCFYSGGQDGIVKVWDVRQKHAQMALKLHVDPTSGKAGAVGFLRESNEDDNIFVTGGADGIIKVLDKRASYGVLHSFIEHMDFIYSLHLHGQLCLSGAGNGMLHVHDWKKGKLLYGLGANKAAVRAIATSSSHLVAAGDDGGVIVYDM